MTSTAPAPLPITVEETDTWIRHPSDVFTGDNRRTLTKGEWERAHALTYGEPGKRCERCDVELFDDPHTDTDLADVCDLCCTVCTPSPSGSQSPEVSPATDDAVAHGTAARVPAGSHPKAITNGASSPLNGIAGGGLSERPPVVGANTDGAQGRNERDRADQTMAATTAVTNESAPASCAATRGTT